MTHDLLDSDIDLAKNLIATTSSDEHVVSTLTLRGLDRNKAAQLVKDLRQGKTVETDVSVQKTAKTFSTSSADSFHSDDSPGETNAGRSRSRRRHHRHPTSYSQRRVQTTTLLVSGVILLIVLGVCAVVVVKRKANSTGQSPPAKSDTAFPKKAVDNPTPAPSAPR